MQNKKYLLTISLNLLISSNVFAGALLLHSPGKIIRGANKPSLNATKNNNASNAISENTTSTVDPTIMKKIQADFNSALNGGVIPKIGETMSWANGTLTRTASNQLKYVNTNNGYYETEMNANSNLTKLASENSGIRNTWIAQYGVNLAGLNEQNLQEGYKNQILHIAQYGLSKDWNKANPWTFGFGLGAYNEEGKVIFYNKDGPLSLNDLQKTNEYQALTGANLVRPEKTALVQASPKPETKPAISVLDNSSISNLDYIKSAKDSSVDMLIKASKKYKDGAITKDQYIQVALQVSQMAEYYNKTNITNESVSIAQSTSAKKTPPGNTTGRGQTEIEYAAQVDSIAAKECQSHPEYSICRPQEKRLQYLKDQFAKAPKPMSRGYENSFGPGFPDSEKAYSDWKQTSKTFVASCEDAVSKYGLFPDQKSRTGTWSNDEQYNRKFYDVSSGAYLGTGGALINISQYVDKQTDSPMIEPDVSFYAVGDCRKIN
jgi:hypothetical protein